MSLCRVEWGIKGRPALPSGVGGQRSPGSLPGGWSGASGGGQLLPPGGFGGHAHLPQQSHHTRDSQESAEGQRSPCSQQANSWGVSRGCRGQMPQGSACLALVYFFQEASEVGRWCPSRVELGGQRSLGSPPGGWLGRSFLRGGSGGSRAPSTPVFRPRGFSAREVEGREAPGGSRDLPEKTGCHGDGDAQEWGVKGPAPPLHPSFSPGGRRSLCLFCRPFFPLAAEVGGRGAQQARSKVVKLLVLPENSRNNGGL